MTNKFEELSMNAWPSLQTNLYDGWVLRFANGYTKRANSVNPIYESTLDFNEKIEYCEKAFFSKGLPVVYKLTEQSCPKGLDKILEDRGYDKVDETSVRIVKLDSNLNDDVEGVVVYNQFADEWINSYTSFSGMNNKKSLETMEMMLSNILGEKICVVIHSGDQAVGCGFGVIENNCIGIFDVIVKKDFRGNGYGEKIMRSILSHASKRKVETAYLQVVVGNIVAETLYKKLGFKEEYRYWYRRKSK